MNAYDIVKTKIIERLNEALEKGEDFKWFKPWNGGVAAATNFLSKRKYTGLNIFLLKYQDYYLTSKQIKQLGGNIKKGSKSEIVVFWAPIKKENEKESDHKDSKLIFKYYRVFNQRDIEGIDFDKDLEEKEINKNEFNFKADDLISEYSKEVPILELNMNKAFYIPSDDKINVPKKGLFKSINHYYSTVFHEMTHSTGHKDRLNRIKEDTRFGDNEYSCEELVAELGSSYLCATFGIENDINNSLAYLKSWSKHIKDFNSNELIYSFQRAQKACDYILENKKYNRNFKESEKELDKVAI